MTVTGSAARADDGRGSGDEPERQVQRRLRVAAYGVCVRDEQLLLSHAVAFGRYPAGWTMPGGGLEHGEDPLDAVVREIEEETGYQVAVDRLLGIDSFRGSRVLDSGVVDDFQGMRIIYRVHVIGGELRDEVGGSTDHAAWVPLADVPALDTVELVGVALRLHREQPPAGRITPQDL
ncbi:NUDIX hydrolase [Streptomyces sp. NBC_00669]|uniref:NUDIX hydrolase n=1 Tax=Streptomyces sp. NBC_00669 TaxID=2976011 RepID=UPI002E345DCF|nr:NUDIX hydrolase [Streptomyces sp. NBC_00669]